MILGRFRHDRYTGKLYLAVITLICVGWGLYGVYVEWTYFPPLANT